MNTCLLYQYTFTIWKYAYYIFFDIFNKDEIKEKDVEYLQQFKDEFIGAFNTFDIKHSSYNKKAGRI